VAAEGVVPSDGDLIVRSRRVNEALRRRSVRLTTVESCTGGLVAHLVTEIPGSSDVFEGGLVTYSNDLKIAFADVASEVLEAHGAVSAQVARAMAEGARHRVGVDVAVAVTGIAGPDGGTAAKPVGLTYVGIADADGVDVRRYVWGADRSGNKRLSAAAALDLVLERLGGAQEALDPSPTETDRP